jgi:hypothetical protein
LSAKIRGCGRDGNARLIWLSRCKRKHSAASAAAKTTQKSNRNSRPCGSLQRRKTALEIGLEVVDILQADVAPQRRPAVTNLVSGCCGLDRPWFEVAMLLP